MKQRVTLNDKTFEVMIPAEEIDKAVAKVAEQINADYADREAPLFLGVLNGSFMFMSDLMKKVDFDVPESQVRRAMDGYLQELAQRAQYSGLDAGYFEQNRDKILKDAEETATRQVRLWYVIDAIAKAEKIEAKEEERGKKVVEFILANVKK